MLAELETAILTRLGALRTTLPRIELRSYGGELGDADLLAEVLAAGMAVLVTVPRARMTRRSARRWNVEATVRLVIGARQARNEAATRHGTSAGASGTYGLWLSCLQLLADWTPLTGAQPMNPTDFNNLVNGRDQRDYLSVVGQTFTVTVPWSPPEADAPLLAGVDLNYYLQPDDGVVDATDHIDLLENP